MIDAEERSSDGDEINIHLKMTTSIGMASPYGQGGEEDVNLIIFGLANGQTFNHCTIVIIIITGDVVWWATY